MINIVILMIIKTIIISMLNATWNFPRSPECDLKKAEKVKKNTLFLVGTQNACPKDENKQ